MVEETCDHFILITHFITRTNFYLSTLPVVNALLALMVPYASDLAP